MKKHELRQWVIRCGALISQNAYWQERTVRKIFEMAPESPFSVNVFCLSEHPSVQLQLKRNFNA